MGVNGDAIELETNEVQALGWIVNDIADELKEWNHKEEPGRS